MKTRIIVVIILTFLLVFLSVKLFSQSIQIVPNSIDISQYPHISADIIGKDTSGKEIRSWSINDFVLTDNNINRPVTNVHCTPQGLARFSLIITCDNSASMRDPYPGSSPARAKYLFIETAILSMLQSLNTLDGQLWELAITSFSGTSIINCPFTNQIDTLWKKTISIYNTVGGQTDFNAGFLYDSFGAPGALELAKKAKDKVVIIFITDGTHDFQSPTTPPRFKVWDSDIISAAVNMNATIFCISMDSTMHSDLQIIADSTRPQNIQKAFNLPPDQDRWNNLFKNILNYSASLGSPAPCQISWITDCSGGNVNLSLPNYNNVRTSYKYTIPDSIKPRLSISPDSVFFLNAPVNKSSLTSITLTAKNNDIDILAPGFSSTDGKFVVSDWGGNQPPFTLKKDSSRVIILTYNAPADSMFHESKISFSTLCDTLYNSASAGWIYSFDVDMGRSEVDKSKQKVAQYILCNNSGHQITLNDITISGPNSGDFLLTKPKPGLSIPVNSCITLIFQFIPGDTGLRTATLNFITSDGNFISSISGTGYRVTNINDNNNFANQNSTQTTTLVNFINPNPASNSLNLGISTTEEGFYRIRIVNVLGSVIADFLQKELQIGTYNFDFDLSGISSGLYFLIIKTPSNLISKQIEIIK